MLSDNARTMGPLRQKLQYVDVWLRRRQLSDRLARRVRAYYTEIWVDHQGGVFLLQLRDLGVCRGVLGPVGGGGGGRRGVCKVGVGGSGCSTMI